MRCSTVSTAAEADLKHVSRSCRGGVPLDAGDDTSSNRITAARNRRTWARILGRRLRKRPTEAEQALWQMLKVRRLFGKFRIKAPVGATGIMVDFWHPRARLVVDVVGPNDRQPFTSRDHLLAGHGVKVLYVTGSDVVDDFRAVLRVILREVYRRGGCPFSLSDRQPTTLPAPASHRARVNSTASGVASHGAAR